MVWGLIYSTQAIFYTDEALSRGASLSQVYTYSEARLLVPWLIVQPSLLFKIGREWNGLRIHI